MVGTLRRLPVTNRRKVGMTSSHHGPYDQGYTRATMAGTKGCQPAGGSQSQKARRSPDRSLQLDSVKSESLVIANQQRRGEYVPGSCTHRPSRHESWQDPKQVAEPARDGAVEGGVGDWDKVVTRQPYRKFRLYHLLSK